MHTKFPAIQEVWTRFLNILCIRGMARCMHDGILFITGLRQPRERMKFSQQYLSEKVALSL